ncbi:hypothetical protein [Campylobacter molothri]|uniref:hypothetical protein n=1 Tax=Campylobacter molothri TaxID=1032242 RepID=UPI001EFA5C7D|nr:hypothetical protein [Campylobacter sp. RM10537]ULO00038.1 hypothetical protein CMOL_0882 [Campylobacter sp. RM10537]
MKILLLNENSVVSRLISLSAKKMSYEFEELNTYSEDLGHYDVIVVDSDVPAPLKVLKEKCDKLIFLAPRNQNVDIDAQILYKPFLPTDFLNLLNGENLKIDDTITTTAIEDSNDETIKDELDINDLNLDDKSSEDELKIDDLNLDFDDKSSEDELKIDDLNLDFDDKSSEDELKIDDLNLDFDDKSSEDELKIDDLNLDFDDEKSDEENLNIEETKDLENSLNEENENLDNLNEETETIKLNDETKEEIKEDSQISQENQDKLEADDDFKLEENIDELDEKDNALEESHKENNEISENHEILNHDEILNDDNLLLQEENLNEKTEQINTPNIQEDSFEDELPLVEEQEKEVDFDDIPEDAEFLGQNKEDDGKSEEEILPVIEEDNSLEEDLINDFGNLSAQDQIKEELAQLDELEYEIDEYDSPQILENFKDTPVFDEKELQIDEEEVVVPNLAANELDGIKESEIQQALGETITEKAIEEKKTIEEEIASQDPKAPETTNEEIVNELSQSIAGAITSSIKDDTLKAALKGMNMNININVTFNEE